MSDQEWTRIPIASDKDSTHRYGPHSFKLLRFASTKPQHIKLSKEKLALKKLFYFTAMLANFLLRDMKQEIAADLELIHVMDRNVGNLSGGELQKFASSYCCSAYAIVVERVIICRTSYAAFTGDLAGFMKTDSVEGSDLEILNFKFSYKPPKMRAKFECN
ncbi:hypothetical protein SASPL_117625 [Salvia splendens]|uniref:Uncharacterized protein n=1 Tax=Salvia splendens TaxID=180675 RepID=A0A8X8ZYC8_SALSN|nr:hypothetical protein SASPL_117625 [Salvia splendens]